MIRTCAGIAHWIFRTKIRIQRLNQLGQIDTPPQVYDKPRLLVYYKCIIEYVFLINKRMSGCKGAEKEVWIEEMPYNYEIRWLTFFPLDVLHFPLPPLLIPIKST